MIYEEPLSFGCIVVSEELTATVLMWMDRLLSDKPVSAILSRLREELPGHVVYHTVAHTQDVMKEALLFGCHDHLEDRQLLLLGWAAAFHDSGFLVDPANHEQAGSLIARENMLNSGSFSETEVLQVQSMILDTRGLLDDNMCRQVPGSELSAYLLDADLANFGREDFLEKMGQVCEELGQDIKTFRTQTLKRLKSHIWYSPAGRHLRSQKSKANIELLEKIVSEPV